MKIKMTLLILAMSALAACSRGDNSSSESLENLDSVKAALTPENIKEEVAPLEVRAAYFSNNDVHGGVAQAKKFTSLLEGSAINAIVVDIKEGGLHFAAQNIHSMLADWDADEEAYITKTVHSDYQDGKDSLAGIVDHFKAKGYYVILRQVVFNDPKLATKFTSLAIKSTIKDFWGKTPWVSPYKKAVRRYNIEVALRALQASGAGQGVGHGADEVQFDYIRFPDPWASDTGYKDISFPDVKDSNKARSEMIASFLESANAEIKAAFPQVKTSIDVFGYVANGTNSYNGIGQRLNLMARHVDAIYPMQYPSHWANKGNLVFGTAHPENVPTKIYRETTQALRSQLDDGDRERISIRPWVQAFVINSFMQVKMQRPKKNADVGQYVLDQIEGIIEGGGNGFALWSVSSKTNSIAINALDEAPEDK